MTKTLFCLLLATGLACGATAQLEAQPLPRPDDVPVQFDHFWLDDGVAQSVVNTIVQDRLGFMWFGTNNGLNRFDGYTFTTYRTIPFDSTSLSLNGVSRLHEGRSGILWVGTWFGGLNALDRSIESFARFAHEPNNPSSLSDDRVWGLHEDRSGRLWVGTGNGLNRLDVETGRFTHFKHDAEDITSLSNNLVYDVLEDGSGRLWVGTGNGLNCLDVETGRFTRYFHSPGSPDVESAEPSNVVSPVMEDPTVPGVLWLASRNGLVRFESQTGDHRRYLAGIGISGATPDPADPGVLWVATETDGLVRLDTRTGQDVSYRHDPLDERSLADDRLRSIYTDRAGTVWVGTRTGINKFIPSRGGFRHLGPFDADEPLSRLVFGMSEDRNGMLWIGTSGGLYQLDRSTGRSMRFFPSSVANLYNDQSGVLWIGTNGNGLYKLDPENNRFTKFVHNPDDSTSLGNDWVRAFYEDRNGGFWIGTRGGLNRLDRSTGHFIRFVHDPNDATSITSGSLITILEDRSGTLWLGTFNGLNRLDRSTGSFMRFVHDPNDPSSLSSNGVFCLHENQEGTLWVGTLDGGLNRMDRATGTFTHYTVEDGLPDNRIYGILEDDTGRLWLSTETGLVRFNPATETVRVFDTDDGLPSIEFNSWAAYESPRTGEMFFGSVNGAVAFYPHWFDSNPHPPQVAITDFKLFNTSVAVGPGSPLEKPVAETGEIELQHDQHSITLDFVGLHYQNPAQHRYQYRLEPYETEWVEAGTRREVTYTNLPPGAYTFRVKAANSDGLWNEEGASLRVTILPPWWRTWWAYALYALLLIGAVVAAYRWQHARIVQREREAARDRELEQAREIEHAYHRLEEAHHDLEETHAHLQATQQQLVHAEKMASLGALTAGIAHEIKNPLNFINNFAEVNIEIADDLRQAWHNGKGDVEDLLADLKQNASVIVQHGRRADGIVQSMMQHASGGRGEREATDVNALVSEYVDLAYHGRRAQAPGFRVEIERALGSEVGSVEMVASEVGRVVLNLLSNAFDAVAGVEEPRVVVTTQRSGEAVEIHVGDNGPGIPKEVREKIFEPFYTTKAAGSGTGLGLSLAYEIVAQGHGGTLAVESEEGQGATFVVTLPR